MSIIFLFWSVFLCSLPRCIYFSDWVSEFCVWSLEGVSYLSLRNPEKQIFKYSVAVETWGSLLGSTWILVWWLGGAEVPSSLSSHWWWRGAAVCLSVAEFSPPHWPPMFQGQKSSKIWICRWVAVPSADLWRGGLVLTCVSQANCLLIQVETLQFGIH